MRTLTTTARTLALVAAMLALVFAACKKSPETIGNDLVDDSDFIGLFRTDTVQVLCHSYFDDSIGTKNVPYAMIGAMNDPVMGLTEAGFYTQFHISSAGQNYGSNPVMDSLVLQLCLSSYYGDTTTWQTIHAFELTDSLSVNGSYCNYSEVAHSPVDVANAHPFRPRPRTTRVVLNNDTVRHAVIRIPLSADLGNYLMTLDSTAYKEPDIFKTHFKGLYVTAETMGQSGAVSYIDITNNTYSVLQLYYHNDDNPGTQLRYNFYITSADTYFNHFHHDYSQGDAHFVQQLGGDTSLGQSRVYLQSTGGVRAKIRFPNVSHWADTIEGRHIVVNEARLVLPTAPATADSGLFAPPSTLVLLAFNEDGSTSILDDYYEGSAYFGGSYDSGSQTVSFRISEYLQSIIMKKKADYGLSLGINGAAYNASRWVINGPEANEGTPLKLIVTYSVVNE